MKWDNSDPNCIQTIQDCDGTGFQSQPGFTAPVESTAWISRHTWYRHPVFPKIQAGTGLPSPAEAAEYTRASIVTHYFDAWGYFSGALTNLLEQRHRSAIHLAYYSSLHSAMSILASAGIGVLDRKHTFIDNSGALGLLTGTGTHVFTWQALSVWMADSRNSITLQSKLMYQNASLDQFVGLLFGGPSTTLFQSWFETWTTDLKTWEADHSARNEVSYRPSFMKDDISAPIQANTHFLDQIWNLVNPWGIDGFGQIDLILFFLTMDHLRRTMQLSLVDTKTRCAAALSTLGVTKEAIEVLIRGYDLHHVRLNPVFRHAKNTRRSLEYPLSAQAVISRSLILIRIAAAMCLNHFPRPSLEAWARSKALDLGITDTLNQPLDLKDLWLDIEMPLETLHDTKPSTWREYRSMEISGLRRLFEFERVGLWSYT